MPMTEPARAALRALCQRIVPDAFGPDNRDAGADLVARVESRISELPVDRASETERFLSLLAGRVGALLLTGRPITLVNTPETAQDRFLRAWERNPSVRLRGAFHGLRKLILWTWWETPRPRGTIAWLGPLHLRRPGFAWEGALAGQSRSDEPVLRVGPGETLTAHTREDVGRREALVAPKRFTEGAVERADVCVIGSGAGGSVIAARLAQAGLEVVVLEAGPAWSPSDSDEQESSMVRKLYAEGGLRTTDDQSIALLQGTCLGGGTTVNWMLMLRPPTYVMEEWEHEWHVPLLGARSLVPALERIEAEVHATLVPGDAHSEQNRALLDGAERLGWSAEEARINARGCVRAGTCGLGCRWGAKQSATETYLPIARRHGARIYCDARVDRIDAPGARGASRRVHVSTPQNGGEFRRFVVEASIVVLAAGAVGTPVILQRSGLGGGGVGRFLRLHPTTAVVGRYNRPVYGGAGIPQSSLCTQFLNTTDGFGFWIECPPFQPALAAAALPDFGASHAARMRDYSNLGAFIVLVRDGAPPARDRSQGTVRVKRGGGISIQYALRGREWRFVAEGIAACARLHLAAGAKDAIGLYAGAHAVATDREAQALAALRFRANEVSLFSAHVNGTCRMGTHPESSGCDPDGKRHGVDNIYIADGSIFPSAPAANPQATIMAAASLIADHILSP